MTNETSSINFTYHNCQREELEKVEVSYNEEVFRQELTPLFETQILVERAEIEIEYDAAHATDQYTIRLVLVSPHLTPNSFSQSASEPASPTRKVIHEAIQALHRAKEKLETEHHHPHD